MQFKGCLWIVKAYSTDEIKQCFWIKSPVILKKRK